MEASARYKCECCGYWTLSSRGMYEICPVCRWEDDPTGQRDGPDTHSGPNHMSINEARRNFARFGAISEERRKHAREPATDELDGK